MAIEEAIYETNQTSSIGATWPPQEASFNRVKGFYNKIISSEQELDSFIDQIENQTKNLEKNGTTRISVRAIVNTNLLHNYTKQTDLVEAIIPLSGTQLAFENTALVYFGQNHSSRASNDKEIIKNLVNLYHVFTQDPRSPENIIQKGNQNGYQTVILDQITENTIQDLTNLYSRFGWNKEQVREICENSDTLIAVTYHNNKIVSAGVAEFANVNLEDSTLRIVEMTEAATCINHTRKGLYNAVAATLMQEIVRRSKKNSISGGQIDLLYGECNLSAPGVLMAARLQGRKFTVESSARYSIQSQGILPQHVPIEGAPRQTQFNELIPTYSTREMLYQRW